MTKKGTEIVDEILKYFNITREEWNELTPKDKLAVYKAFKNKTLTY
jgi:hypothetical protein